MVDPDSRTVTVHRRDIKAVVHRSGDELHTEFIDGLELGVDDVFVE